MERGLRARDVYSRMLWIYRPRPGDVPLAAPFISNRPLTQEEFSGAVEWFISLKAPRPERQVKARRSPYTATLAAVLDKAWAVGDLDAYKIIGTAAFGTKSIQKTARQKLRLQSQSGTRVRRALLRQGRIALPQARHALSPIEMLQLGRYLRGRQFVWAFLWGEARALAFRTGKKSRAEILAQSDALAGEYEYLGLSSAQIRVGFESNDPAARDTAGKFNITPSHVRPLLTKSGI